MSAAMPERVLSREDFETALIEYGAITDPHEVFELAQSIGAHDAALRAAILATEQERDAAHKRFLDQVDYAVAMQQAIEACAGGRELDPVVAARCPHHAAKLAALREQVMVLRKALIDVDAEMPLACTCHEAYTSRQLTDHECHFHDYGETVLSITAAARRIVEGTTDGNV